ncbi:hypothetical protein F5B20DRAFT_545901 [Whalleya microplaca]|nr:hypothetical protein F5B20DRAFT_545901 [Whalleya microplaca]
MQLTNILLASAALGSAVGSIIPALRDLRTPLPVPANYAVSYTQHSRRAADNDAVLTPGNFAHIQEDRRKVQLSWEKHSR